MSDRKPTEEDIIEGHETVSDKIRSLANDGYDWTEIENIGFATSM